MPEEDDGEIASSFRASKNGRGQDLQKLGARLARAIAADTAY